MRSNIFLFHVLIKPIWKKHEIKILSIVKSIKFDVLTSKLLLQKKSQRKEMW